MQKKLYSALIIFVLLLLANPQGASALEKITLMLDWFPNVDHIPIYTALEKGFFQDEGLNVEILSPSETSDSLKLAATGKVDIAVAYEPQVIIAHSSGIPLKVTGRLVGHPLSTLLFLKDKGIETPKDLEGKLLGYTVPGMMDILLEAFAKLNGIDSYKAVNVGFTIVPSLISGKVDTIMGPYKNYETVELELEGYDPKYFALEEMGIPDYDELIFVSGKDNFKKKHEAIKGFSRAIGKAITFTRANPETALNLYLTAIPDAPGELETKAFKRTIDLYANSQVPNNKKWQAFADFAFEHGLVTRKVGLKDLLITESDL